MENLKISKLLFVIFLMGVLFLGLNSSQALEKGSPSTYEAKNYWWPNGPENNYCNA